MKFLAFFYRKNHQTFLRRITYVYLTQLVGTTHNTELKHFLPIHDLRSRKKHNTSFKDRVTQDFSVI